MKTRSILFSLLLILFMISHASHAKDGELQQRMVDLEHAFIPVLVLTSKESPKSLMAAKNLTQVWNEFANDYRTYRASWRNWISYFYRVQEYVNKTDELIDEGYLLEAHEELENIRTTLAELRSRNGFPKFTSDKFTAFHTIMGEIIALTKKEFDDNTIDILEELYKEASLAWSMVEKNNVDLEAWNLTEADYNFYITMIHLERDALDDFEQALENGNAYDIAYYAMQLKEPQAKAYLTLGDFINMPMP